MTDNLKIEILKQQLNGIINNTQLPLGIINLIVQTFAKELNDLYIQTTQKEYEEYQKELKEEQEKNDQEEVKDE